jgi:YYY domain-containing protein
MDFSILNVLLRTDTFPPPDPWFAGAPLNYYYFGHYLITMLTKLTRIAPHVTYNLAFALIPALVAAEAFSILYNLTRRYVWGSISVLFATILGNLDGFFLLLANWRTRIPVLDVLIGQNTALDKLIGTEHYYRLFRPAHEVIQYTVHEFPFWTFIFVDLHAHLLNMPFLLAAFLVGLHLLALPEQSTFQQFSRGSSPKTVSLLTALLLMLLLGTLGVISSWDYPTSVILLLLCAILRLLRSYRSFQHTPGSAWRQLLLLICVIPGSFLLYRPFYAEFSRADMGLEWVGNQTTQLSAFLTVFGFFIWLAVGYLLLRLHQGHTSKKVWLFFALSIVGLFGGWNLISQVFGRNYATLFFVLSMLALTGYLLVKHQLFTRSPWRAIPSEAYILLCMAYACLITAGCEIVFVRDFLQGGEYKRMNTIFKFYLPAWYLLAFVAVYALYALWQHSTEWRISFSVLGARYVLGSAAILFIMAAVFPIVSSYSRRQSDFYGRKRLPPTLNGLAFLEEINRDEYQAIQWLNNRVAGTPTILEAVHDDYRYEYARISANTGLPTVLGWPSHADQREHWGKTHPRRRDVIHIYATLDVQYAYELLQKYQVRYVYIGKTERQDFSEEELRKFQEHPEYFREIFRSGDTVIYEVL